MTASEPEFHQETSTMGRKEHMSPQLSPASPGFPHRPPPEPMPGVNPEFLASMVQGMTIFLEFVEIINTSCPYLTYNWK